MTQNTARKAAVRERMSKTGENYTTAARRLNAEEGLQTWTFMGHWEGSHIVVEHWVEGEVEDRRRDTGYWSEGLWADSASGRTVEEAQAAAIKPYEDDLRDEGDEDDLGDNEVILVPYQVVVDVQVNVKTGEVVEVRTIDETLEPHATLDVVTPTELNRVDEATEARAREIAETTEWPSWR